MYRNAQEIITFAIMLTFANAKINLGLNIIGKRSDGYHAIETVFYPVRIQDVVELCDADETGIVVKGIEIPGMLEDNLCLRVYQRMQNDFNLPPQQIILLKNIPVGAGLGGGSSDAAFLIRLTDQKFSLGLDEETLMHYARLFGADCAFFIKNEPVFAWNKGDEFESLPLDLRDYFIVLVKPPVHVSTADAYRRVAVKAPERSLSVLIREPVESWKAHIKNDFETVVFEQYPEIALIKQKLYEAGAVFALMSGSGSSVFGIFKQPVKLPELEKDNLVFLGI